MKFTEGQTVIFENKKTEIVRVNQLSIVILNPNWSYDLEKECMLNGIDYDIPYEINVNEISLKCSLK